MFKLVVVGNLPSLIKRQSREKRSEILVKQFSHLNFSSGSCLRTNKKGRKLKNVLIPFVSACAAVVCVSDVCVY